MHSLTVSASPHIINKKSSARTIMIDVLIALVPVLFAAVYYFGYHVLINLVVCLVFCFGGELLYNVIVSPKKGKEAVKTSSVRDLSFAVTAVILALNLPSVMIVKGWGLNFYSGTTVVFSFDTVFLCAIGSLFAIIVAKMLFGGIGKNFANPADCGRVFLFIAFSTAGAFDAVGASGIGLDAVSSATWLSNKEAVTGGMLFNMFVGNTGASAVGETCAIAILVGYIYLCVRKVIDFRIPLAVIGSFAMFILFFDVLPSGGSGATVMKNWTAQILSGGLLFGSVFMATDYSTTPNSLRGNMVFAVGLGLFTALIRAFAALPEGFSFALLVMNIATPLIDRYIFPKPFGYVKPEKTKKSEKNEGNKTQQPEKSSESKSEKTAENGANVSAVANGVSRVSSGFAVRKNENNNAKERT